MSRKITIIGAGHVGATIAYTLSLGNNASEIVVIDLDKSKAEGEVMDIIQGTGFRDPISVISGDYADAADSEVVIITSGVGRKPGQTRLELAQNNVNILKDITPRIVQVAPHAVYVIVSNPVDIMTYVFTKISGLPESQVMGSGTALDTARLRYRLSDHFQVAQKNVHAYVFGEHGDTSFIPWSLATISGCKLTAFEKLMQKDSAVEERIDRDEILQYVQKSGGEIISKKGATYYAVAASVNKIVGALFGTRNCVETVSTMLHGEYGIKDVCLSVLALIGPEGVKEKLPVQLTEDEANKLHASATALKEAIKGLDF